MKRKPPNWRARLTVVKLSKHTDAITFNLEFDKKPKGFSKQQGSLVIHNRKPYVIAHSRVSKHFHHRNIGYMLYVHALKELGQLSTEYNQASVKAQKLWRRLMSDYEHHIRRDGIITVYNRRIRMRKRK